MVSDGKAMALIRDGRTARHVGPLFADAAGDALALIEAIVASENGPLLIDAVYSQDEFLAGAHRRRMDDRAAVPAHVFRPRHRGGRAGHSPSPAPNLDRNALCIIAKSNPTSGKLIAEGTVIPAHPLALDANRALDKQHQRALTRYYIDAGAGGLAVGVHTTQFAIRDIGMYRPVLELAAETAANWTTRPLAMVAGLAGPTQQAITEAKTARGIGYHAGLLSLAAMKSASEDEIIAHCKAVAQEIPLVGFYLQPAVGGVILGANFWRRFAEIDNVVAIKIAPFNRYRTLDVLRGVAAAGALDRITLYTGNDDHILLDLVLPFDLRDNGVSIRAQSVAACSGTGRCGPQPQSGSSRPAKPRATRKALPADLLALDARVTDCNSAFFDVANDFHGCIAGCHEILRRQGLMQGIWCLDPTEGLSPGQMQEIDRVCRDHADLSDDAFVAAHLQKWLA